MVLLFTLPTVLNGFGRMCGEIWILAAAIILRQPGTQLGSSWWRGRDHWEVTYELSIQFLLLKKIFCLSWPESSCCLQAKVSSWNIMCPAVWMSWVAERSRCRLERKVKELWSPHFNLFRILCIYWHFCCRKTDSHRMNTAMLLASRWKGEHTNPRGSHTPLGHCSLKGSQYWLLSQATVTSSYTSREWITVTKYVYLVWFLLLSMTSVCFTHAVVDLGSILEVEQTGLADSFVQCPWTKHITPLKSVLSSVKRDRNANSQLLVLCFPHWALQRV